MKVLMTGSSGFLGTALRRSLEADGHAVAPLVRRDPRSGSEEIGWDPRRGRIEARDLEGADAAVHLAGIDLVGKRWTEQHKARALDSRVRGTRLFSEALATLEAPPRVLVSSSAIGYYGDRGDEVLTEASGPGAGFMATLCRAWEGQTEPARAAGIRVVNTRTGLVLHPSGGILRRMLLPFRAGLGARLGRGDQWWSWITLDDYLRAVLHLIGEAGVSGPVNVVAPNPVTNADFTSALGRALRRPAVFVAPVVVLKVAFGPERADDALFASQRVRPAVLERAGYRFAHAHLDDALQSLIGARR
jgi:uncharacterized protein (TIGR01777 family)